MLLLQVLEEVRFLRLEKQDFSLRGTSEKLESASEAQNTSAESYHRVLKERSKSGMEEHIEIDNQSISQPCQARIPRQLRSSHSCHKIHKYSIGHNSLESAMYMWHERNQCWKSDAACDTLPSPCTSRGESHSSGAAGGSASASCREALLMDIGDRVDWEKLGECLACVADGLSNGLNLIRCAENAPSLFDLFEHKNVPKQQQYQTWHTYDIPPLQPFINDRLWQWLMP